MIDLDEKKKKKKLHNNAWMYFRINRLYLLPLHDDATEEKEWRGEEVCYREEKEECKCKEMKPMEREEEKSCE